MWRKHRSILIILLFSALIGVVGMGKPVDQMLAATRYHIDPIPASGDIVAVGIDQKSLQEMGAWPWDRTRHAELIDKLYAAGAKRVVFDIDFSAAGTPNGNAAFADALARNDAKTWLLVIPPEQAGATALPIPEIADHARFASSESSVRLNNVVTSYQEAEQIGGMTLPSLSVILSHQEAKRHSLSDKIYVNYAIDPATIPYWSAADIISKDLGRSVRNKTVVIGTNDRGLGDIFYSPSAESVSGMFIAILGAETLKRGDDVRLGWVALFLISCLAAQGASLLKRRRGRVAARIIWTAVLINLPMLLTYINCSVEVFPSLVVFLLLSTAKSFDRIKKQALEDELDGLGSVALAEDEGLGNKPAVICLVVANDAQIRATLSAAQQQKIWNSLHRRLSFSIGHRHIYRQANCLFWASDERSFDDIRDQLDGLNAVLRMPPEFESSGVMIDGYFGVDMQQDLPLRARIAGAIAAVQNGAGQRVICNDPIDRAEALWGLTFSSEVNKALERGDFWVAYQPQVDCKTAEIIGVEALVRWTHPDKGFLSPVEFIETADKSGDLNAITEFVLDDVAKMMVATAKDAPSLQWSVNVSPRQLVEGAVGKMIANIFAGSGADPWRLTVELTETARLASTEEAGRELACLRALGVELSADDYGSGVSTLENLKMSQVKELKIDKQFIMAMKQGNAEYHMVSSTIMMAHAMELRVVAEGVETSDIATLLWQLRCDRLQGYYFAKPMKKEEFLKHLLMRKMAA